MLGISFNYHESDDADASIYGMSFDEVKEFIHDHNEYFETDYQSVQEFNEGEQKANGIRHIEAEINFLNQEQC